MLSIFSILQGTEYSCLSQSNLHAWLLSNEKDALLGTHDTKGGNKSGKRKWGTISSGSDIFYQYIILRLSFMILILSFQVNSDRRTSRSIRLQWQFPKTNLWRSTAKPMVFPSQKSNGSKMVWRFPLRLPILSRIASFYPRDPCFSCESSRTKRNTMGVLTGAKLPTKLERQDPKMLHWKWQVIYHNQCRKSVPDPMLWSIVQ